MSVSRDPIREQLVEARRTQILDAAATVFANKGFHRATTREIARTAGVSEGTIYNYFDSKGDLLIGLMIRLINLDSLNEELVEALRGDVRDFFVTMFRDRSVLMQKGQVLLQAVLPEVMVNPDLRERFYQQFVLRIATLLEQYIQARIEMGDVRPVNAKLMARALQGMFVGLIFLHLLGDEPLRSGWADVPDELATLIFDGLRSRAEE